MAGILKTTHFITISFTFEKAKTTLAYITCYSRNLTQGEIKSMRNILKLAVVLAFLLAGGFIFVTPEMQATPASATFDNLESPRSLYIQNCARCHGANGKAQTALGRKLEADDLTISNASTAKIIRTITNGRGEMPSFRRKLTKTQIASVAGYAKSL